MNFEDAIKLKTGSSVFSADGKKLLVCAVDFSISFTGNQERKCIIHTINNDLQKKKYSYEEVFYDKDFLSDEENILVNWISNNSEFVRKNYDVIHIISHCFLQGFSEGYRYQKVHSIQELLQK